LQVKRDFYNSVRQRKGERCVKWGVGGVVGPCDYCYHELVSFAGAGFAITPLPGMPAGLFASHGCPRSSPAGGRASWSSSKHSSRKFCASADMSDGMGGFAAEDPICAIGGH